MNVILKLLGLVGGSVTNTAGGIANYAAMGAAGLWAWAHREEPVHIALGSFSFDTNMATVGLAALAAFFYLELQRRTRPIPPEPRQERGTE